VLAVGRATAHLLFYAGWMHRRKESAVLLDDTWVRRSMSMDFTIPRASEQCGRTASGESLYVVPVALLPKASPYLMRFDFRDERGSLPLPTRRQNALAAYSALLYASHRALTRDDKLPSGGLPRNFRDELLFVAFAPQEYAEPVSESIRSPGLGIPQLWEVEDVPDLELADVDLQSWCSSLARREPQRSAQADLFGAAVADVALMQSLHVVLATDPMCSWLLSKLTLASPVLAHVTAAPGRRKLVYLCHDANVLKEWGDRRLRRAERGWESVPFYLETPFVGAESYHFECLMPDGLEALHSELRVYGSPPVTVPTQALRTSRELERPLAEEHEASRPEEFDATNAAYAPSGVSDKDTAFGTAGGGSTGAPLGAAGPSLVSSDHETRTEFAEYAPAPVRGTRVHHYVSDAVGVERVTASVDVIVSREAFVTQAWPLSLAVFLVIAGCAGLAQPLVRHGGGAPSLLLLFPGLLATVVAAARGHRVIIRMLSRARRALLVSAVTAFLAGALLPLIHTGGRATAAWWHRAYWGVLALAAFGAFGVLALARVLPRPPGHENRVGRLIKALDKIQNKRLRKRAQRRQRQLIISVTGLTEEQVTQLAAGPPNVSPERPGLRLFARQLADPLPVREGPRRRYFLRQDPSLRIVAPDEMALLRVSARPSDPLVKQRAVMAARLAATLRWLCAELDEGYHFAVLWPRRPKLIWFAKRAVHRWRAERRRSDPEQPWRCRNMTERIRLGDLPLNSEFFVVPDPPR
jgi:hypothetical protein